MKEIEIYEELKLLVIELFVMTNKGFDKERNYSSLKLLEYEKCWLMDNTFKVNSEIAFGVAYTRVKCLMSSANGIAFSK